MDGWLVSELHFELGRLRSQPGDNISGVVHISDYDGSSRITDVENVGDGVWDDQFVGNLLLATYDDGILASDGD